MKKQYWKEMRESNEKMTTKNKNKKEIGKKTMKRKIEITKKTLQLAFVKIKQRSLNSKIHVGSWTS